MRLATWAALTSLLGAPLVAERAPAQWPRFRGPNGSGVSDVDKPPVSFGPSAGRLWKVAVPPGHSSPVVWNDHVFLTGVEDGGLVVLALRRSDGSVRWRQRAPAATLEKVHRFSSPASSTPATDGERVYAYFGSYGLLAYDFDGREMWRAPLPAPPTQYGSATSPIVFDGKVILQLDGNDGRSGLLAFDARSGAVAWQTPRPLLRESWSTPMIWTHDGVDEVITVGMNRVSAYAPRDGAERWSVGGLTIAPITVAVHGGGLLFASSRYGGSQADPIEVPQWTSLLARFDADKDGQLSTTEVPSTEGVHIRKDMPKETPGNFLPLPGVIRMVDSDKDGRGSEAEWNASVAFLRSNSDNVLAIRPGGTGDVTKSHVAWRADRGIPEMPSPIFYRDRLYCVRDGGMVTSYEPASGKIVLDRQRLGALGQYAASPVAADGRIYAASGNGVIVVFRAGDTLDVLARNDLGESITATPAIAGDTLYVRSATSLWAFGS